MNVASSPGEGVSAWALVSASTEVSRWGLKCILKYWMWHKSFRTIFSFTSRWNERFVLGVHLLLVSFATLGRWSHMVRLLFILETLSKNEWIDSWIHWGALVTIICFSPSLFTTSSFSSPWYGPWPYHRSDCLLNSGFTFTLNTLSIRVKRQCCSASCWTCWASSSTSSPSRSTSPGLPSFGECP